MYSIYPNKKLIEQYYFQIGYFDWQFQVATSHDTNYVVAVTSNNMVCIWKRSSGDGDDSSAASTSSEN